MNWLLRRVLALCSILAVMFAAVLLVARLNRTPDVLQALGFDVCDGVPCFKGIKLDMDWEKARQLASEANEIEIFLEFPVKSNRINAIRVVRSDSIDSVVRIQLEPVSPHLLPITIGEVVTRYGPPCRLAFGGGSETSQMMILVYPSFNIVFIEKTVRHDDFYLTSDTQITYFDISTQDFYVSCNCPIEELNGPWRGFTSAEIYLSRNRRDSATPQH